MDRIIKFRGKIKDKKRAKELNLKVGDWVYGYYFHDEGLKFINGKSQEFDKHYIINTPYVEEWIEVIPETVGQFTGLYDKNGKEIYERDTVLNLIAKLQKENEEKDKQIDLMSEYISNFDTDEDICKEQADNNCDDINREVECKDCIKQYFEKEAKKKGE